MRYRYRAKVLFGAWHSSSHMACADAIRAGQAHRNEDGTIMWRGGAALEVVADGAVAREQPSAMGR